MKTVRPLDFFILALIILAAAFSFHYFSTQNGERIVIDADGQSYEFSLTENTTHQVQGPLGITTIEVLNGKVRIVDSPCPGKNCINQGWSSPIVCLPNKVIVRVEAHGEFDAIAE